MESALMNQISANIHLHCAKIYGNPIMYTQDSVRFRSNIQTCFQNILYQRNLVSKGFEEFYRMKSKS